MTDDHDLFLFVEETANRVIEYLNTAEPVEAVKKRLDPSAIDLDDVLNIPVAALQAAQNWSSASVEQRPTLLTTIWAAFNDENAPTAEMYLHGPKIRRLLKELNTLEIRLEKYRNLWGR